MSSGESIQSTIAKAQTRARNYPSQENVNNAILIEMLGGIREELREIALQLKEINRGYRL